jgi:hypothetical protein
MKFELIDHDFSLRIEPIKYMFPDDQTDQGKNLVYTKIIINAGGFKAEYHAKIMTLDYEKFKQELRKLYNNLNGFAGFDCFDGYLTMKIQGDGLGHFTADCSASDNPGFEQRELIFYLHFDQTQINDLVSQLSSITKEYPIKGDFRIKNE